MFSARYKYFAGEPTLDSRSPEPNSRYLVTSHSSMAPITIDAIVQHLKSGNTDYKYTIQNVADPQMLATVIVPYPAVMPPYPVRTLPPGSQPPPNSQVSLLSLIRVEF